MKCSTKYVVALYNCLVSLPLIWAKNLGSIDSSCSTETYCSGAIHAWMALSVFLWCNMGACSWLCRIIICIWVALRWLDSWVLYLTGIKSWYCWRVIVPACDAISWVMLGGVMLSGVLYQTQWLVWAPEVSLVPCTISRRVSPHLFYPYCCWVKLGLTHPFCTDKLCAVPSSRCADPIIDGGGPSWKWPWIVPVSSLVAVKGAFILKIGHICFSPCGEFVIDLPSPMLWA